MTLLDDRT